MAIDYAKLAEKYKGSSETYGSTGTSKYDYYTKRASQNTPTATTSTTKPASPTTTNTPVAKTASNAVSEQQKKIDYWKSEIDKQTNVQGMEERIKESRAQYKKAQENLGKIQQQEKGIDSSKFLTEKDIYEKTPKQIEQQVQAQSVDSKDFDLQQSLQEKEAKIRDMAMDPSIPVEERQKLTQQADKYLEDMNRYEEDKSAKQAAEEKQALPPEDQKMAYEEEFKQRLIDSERKMVEQNIALRDKYALDYEKFKSDQELKISELEQKTLSEITKRQTELEKLLLDEGSDIVGQRPDVMGEKITSILNGIEEQQKQFSEQMQATQDQLSSLFDQADEDTKALIEEYTPKIEELNTELTDTKEKLDAMNAAELEMASDVLKEVGGEAPQSYINALIAKRQKDTLGERYLLETKYGRIQDDLNFYQDQLDTRKNEVKQERNDRFGLVQSQLSFLQNQQSFQFSSQMQMVGLGIEEQRYQEAQEFQQKQFKVQTILSLGELDNQKAQLEMQFEKDRYNRDFQEKQLAYNQQMQQLEAQMQIAQMPKGFSVEFGGQTLYGMEEDDNVNIVNMVNENGESVMYGIDKKTGQMLYENNLGKLYQESTQGVTDELALFDAKEQIKLRNELIKSGKYVEEPVGYYQDNVGAAPGDTVGGGQCGSYANAQFGETIFGDYYREKISKVNSMTPAPGSAFIQDTGTEYGHVGIVKKVLEGGRLLVVDQNSNNDQKVSERVIDASKVAGYYVPKTMVQKQGQKLDQNTINAKLLQIRNMDFNKSDFTGLQEEAKKNGYAELFNQNYLLGQISKNLNIRGDSAKLLAISETSKKDINDLFSYIEKNKLKPRDIILDYKLIQDPTLRNLMKNVSDKLGRMRSGAAITEEEESRFLNVFTDPAYFLNNNYDTWKSNVNRVYDEFNFISDVMTQGINIPSYLEQMQKLNKQIFGDIKIYDEGKSDSIDIYNDGLKLKDNNELNSLFNNAIYGFSGAGGSW